MLPTLLVLLLTCTALPVAAKTTVDFWFGESPEAYIQTMEKIIEQFHAEYPDIEIVMSQHGDIQGTKLEQLKVTIAAGVPPDIAYLDGTAILELGMGNGMFIPINELVSQDVIDSLNYLPVPTQDFSYKGTWYGLPFRTDSRGMFVNEDHFNEAGVDPRHGFADLAELDATAAKLTLRDGDGNIMRLGFAPRSNNFGREMPWLWVFGGEMFDWETMRPTLTEYPQNVDALNWMWDYADRYGPLASSDTTAFMDQRSSMHINSTTRLQGYAEQRPNLNWWVVDIPHPEGGVKTTLSTVLGPAIPRGAENPEAAVQFILFLARPETQIFWYENTQSLPTNYDAFFEILRSMEDPRERTMVELLPVAHGYPPLFAYFVAPEFLRQTDLMRQRQITPEQALETTQRIVWSRFVEVFGGE